MDAVKTGALIARMRKEKGLTQRELAEKVYVSVQAVSKWELGKNFPDLSLMEPLSDALGLSVSELLAGERGEAPRDELVRDTLRLGEEQLRPKIKRWKGLFVAAAALLLAVVLGLGYVWVRGNTEWLPQRKTVIRELRSSVQEDQIANALGFSSFSLHLYEVTLADDFSGYNIQAELWTHDGGMEQSWPLMESSAEERKLFGSRRQLLVLSIEPHSEEWSEEEQRWTKIYFDCGVSFAGSSTSGMLIGGITNPYAGGGAAYGPRKEPQTVDPEEGVVLLTLSIGGPGGVYAPGGLPPEHEGAVYLVVRMYCK